MSLLYFTTLIGQFASYNQPFPSGVFYWAGQKAEGTVSSDLTLNDFKMVKKVMRQKWIISRWYYLAWEGIRYCYEKILILHAIPLIAGEGFTVKLVVKNFKMIIICAV